MMTYELGEIILVEFHYPRKDLRKKRPAVVILDIGDQDIILAPITSRERDRQGDCRVNDWKNSGLLKPSWIRLAKVTCLEKSDIDKSLGKRSPKDKKKVVAMWQMLFAPING